jgi:hypothetical protein
MRKMQKKIICAGHLEDKIKKEKLRLLQQPCIFQVDCPISKSYCTVEISLGCRTYNFYSKYERFDYGRQLGT